MTLLTGYKLVFDDEFNVLSAGLPGTPGIRWETEPFYRQVSNGGQGTINPTPPGQPGSLFRVSNGVLDMAVTSNSAPYLDTNPNGVPGGFSQQYGYFEMSAKLTSVAGFSDAFWLLPNSGPWPPEIDIEEHPGAFHGDVYFTSHGGSSTTPADNYNIYNGPDLSAGFHTYGLAWTPTTSTWYLDGVKQFSAPTASNQNQPFNIILSAYANHNLDWTPNAQPGTSDHMYVDWVHVYSSNPSAVAIAGEAGYADHDGSTSAASRVMAPALPQTSPAPAGSTHVLDLALSEDAWQGDAKFTVSVDGVQVGGVRTVSTLHASGLDEHVKLTGPWAAGTHLVQMSFINDAYGGSAATDRNLYVDSIAYDGSVCANSSAVLLSNGTRNFTVGNTTPTISAPPRALTLHMSEDAWQGDAAFKISIDGKLVDTSHVVTASHRLGSAQDFTFTGDLAAGSHDVAITFLNDAYGGSPQTDRNLYVDSIDFGSRSFAGATFYTAGTQHFAIAS